MTICPKTAIIIVALEMGAKWLRRGYGSLGCMPRFCLLVKQVG